MDMKKLRQILRLSEEPSWAMRSPDQQVVPPPEAPMPIKQGGIPTPAGATPPKQPNKMNPGQLKKAADSMLNQNTQGSSETNAVASAEQGPNTSLSSALRLRRLARKSSESMPQIGSIGYSSKVGF